MTNLAVTVPQEVKENPIAFFERLSISVVEITDTQTIRNRLALIAAAQAWANQYGKQADPVLRHVLASRLIHEKRLGELLNGNTEVIRDDFGKLQGRQPLPKGITKNVSPDLQGLVPAGGEKGVSEVLEK